MAITVNPQQLVKFLAIKLRGCTTGQNIMIRVWEYLGDRNLYMQSREKYGSSTAYFDSKCYPYPTKG